MLCIFHAAECMYALTEQLYFDSKTIFQAPGPSSASGVAIRVCGVRLARPTWGSALL